jgi:general stress protein 26
MKNNKSKALALMDEHFGHDTLLSVATIDGERPAIRTVNSYYENGAFYVVTYALSGKLEQIKKNANVAVCGEWFTAHGIGENLGYVLAPDNAEIMTKLREAYAEWYYNGDINEDDPNTCLLRIRLTDAVVFSHGTKYEIDFSEGVL